MRREASCLYPKRFLTIIIDGMDQKKTNIPILYTKARNSKQISNLQQVRTHLLGVLVHRDSGNIQNNPYKTFAIQNTLLVTEVHTCVPQVQYFCTTCFSETSGMRKVGFGHFDLMQYPHDANLNLTVLLETLCGRYCFCKSNRKDKFTRAQTQVLYTNVYGNPFLAEFKDALGTELHLQTDSASDNKNKTALDFLGLLVHLGIFEEVFLVYIMHNLILNYFLFINKYLLVTYTVTNILFLLCYLHMLPVGHTHEDIDSMFSNFSSSLKGDIMTLDGKI